MRMDVSSRKYMAFRTHNEIYKWLIAVMDLAVITGLRSLLMRIIFAKPDYKILLSHIDSHLRLQPINGNASNALARSATGVSTREAIRTKGELLFMQDCIEY